jgi:serine/threonine-protein kinase
MLQIGQQVLAGRYEVVDLLCEGGEATVGRGVDTTNGQMMAIRALNVSPSQLGYKQALARFRRVGSLRIEHPNVLDPLDYGEEDGVAYIIFRFVDGPTLEQHVNQHGSLPVAETIGLIHKIAAGLSACHARGITHRDIKPANFLLEGGFHPLIIDLGICSIVGERTLTKGNGLQGSLHFMAPEQIRNPACADQRLDLYALGATLYFMLTGCAPIQGQTQEEILASVLHWTPPSPRSLNPNIPVELDAACMRMLAKDPEQRFPTAEAFIAELGGSAGAITQARYCRVFGRGSLAQARFCTACGASTSGVGMGSACCLACGERVGDEEGCARCNRSFSPADHRITFEVGTVAGTVFRIPQGRYTIGRETLSPRDHQLSRKQIEVVCNNGTVSIADAGSANGSFVDGRFAGRPIALTPGVQIVLAGNQALYFNGKEGN